MRPGDNLFAESIVCVDGETGERIWYFQAVHHGLWDYDFPTAPNLLDITVDGREGKIRAIAQASKQAFVYVFDRVTGEPVWPIEERPVLAGDVPGEWYSPTQPFPTKPAPFDLQGITEDDLIDFTPELRKEAIRIAERAQLGPLFMPPTVRGDGKPIIQAPGPGGGVNWHGTAVDPETGRMFVPSQTRLRGVELVKYPPPATVGYFTDPWAFPVPGPQGLPLTKPPYKRITAIDLNSGDHVWMSPAWRWPKKPPGAARFESARARWPQRDPSRWPARDEDAVDCQLGRPVRRRAGGRRPDADGLPQGQRRVSRLGGAACCTGR